LSLRKSLKAKIRWGLVLGAERFAKKVRGRIQVNREHEGQDALKKRRSFGEIVKIVERVKGEKWESFRDRYGDWGRNLILWAGRTYGGLSLLELGRLCGGVDYSAVAMGIKRLDLNAKNDRKLKAAMKQVAKHCAM